MALCIVGCDDPHRYLLFEYLGVNYGKPERVLVDRRCTHVANEDMDKLGVDSGTLRLDH
jgi:hypothetical protein